MWRRVLLLSGVLLWVSAPALAQPAEVDGGVDKKVAPEGLTTPRTTMRTFLEQTVAAAEGGEAFLDEAARCLDLSQQPAAGHAEAGRELAIKLKEVIDRIRYVEYGDIPNAATGPPYVFHRDAATGAAITIAAGEDGAWRFTAETVAAIDDLYRALESRRKVAGAAESPASLSPSLWLRSKMPDALKDMGFLMEHWQWLALIILIVVGVLLARLIRGLLTGPVKRWLRKRQLVIPHQLIGRTLRPTGLIFTAMLWVMGLRWVGLSAGLHGFFVVIVKFLAAFGFVWLAFRVVDVIAHVLQGKAETTTGRFDDLLVPLFRKSAKIVITAIGIVFIADVVGISPASLLAGLGLGGLAVALAAQDTVKNFFGSLTVLLDRPFEVGDAVIIGGGTEGVIEEVGFRSTRIRTYDNTLITLPNSNLISAKVDNLGRRNFRRFKTTIGVTYDTPPDKLRAFVEGLRELIRGHTLTQEGATVYLSGFGPSSLDILFVAKFTTAAYDAAANAQHELIIDIVTLASRLGVDLAFPTQTVLVHQGEAKDAQAHPVSSTEEEEQHYRLGREEAARILARQQPAETAAD